MERFDYQELMKRLTGSESWDFTFDAAAFEQKKADGYNASRGTLTGYDCPKCLNRGNFAFLREGGTMAFRDCSCMAARRSILRMEASGLKNVIRDLTFDRFETAEPWQRTAKKTAEDYAAHPRGWLLLCGQSGAGKSHLCTAAARKLLLEGMEVAYMSWRDEATRIKSCEGPARAEAVERLKNVRVLYIDDLFKTGRTADGIAAPTAGDINLAFELLNHRYLNRALTLISTEKYPEELAMIDEAVGGRILELSREHTVCVERNTCRNYRLRGLLKAGSRQSAASPPGE